MVKTRRNAAAVDSGRSGAGAVCLAPDAASSRSGRVYAAYGGVYVCTALLWLRFVDGVKLSHYDWAGALIALCGMLIIVAGWGRRLTRVLVIVHAFLTFILVW
jgi:small multidrug resistance family-3 protein